MRDNTWQAPLTKISWRSWIPKAESLEDAVRAAYAGQPSRVSLAPEAIVPYTDAVPAPQGNPVIDDAAQVYFGRRNYWTPAVEAVVMPHASLFTQGSLIVIDGRLVCAELDYNVDIAGIPDVFDRSSGRRYCLSDSYKEKARAAPEIPGITLIVHPRYHRNYTHWHLEGLTQFGLLADHGAIIDTVILPKLNAFQAGSVQCLKISKKMIQASEDVCHFEVAIFSTLHLLRTWIHPSLAGFLNSLRGAAFSYHDVVSSGRKPIYLSRSDSRIRKMVNEDVLCEALSARGFEIVVAGALSYREQLQAFANASILVSPHGSGLTNMLYTPPGTPLVELRPLHAKGRSPFFDYTYRTLAGMVGRPYTAWFFENEPDTDEWRVDIDRVIAAVRPLVVDKGTGEA